MRQFGYTCKKCGITFNIEINDKSEESENDLSKVIEFDGVKRAHEHGYCAYREYSPLLVVNR